MTIKSRLIYTLVFFVCIILVVGLLLVGSNTIQRYYSDNIIKAVTLNGLVKVISREFDDAKKSLTRYFFIGNELELKNYRDSYDSINTQFIAWGQLSGEGVASCFNDFNAFSDLVDKMLKIDNKAKLISVMERDFIPVTEKLQKKFAEEMNKSNLLMQSLYEKNEVMMKYTTIFSLLIIILAVIAGMIIGVKIYRSIMTPLRTLCGSAEMIGKGEMREPIDLKIQNEFSELASAFNKMTEDLKNLESRIIQVDRLSSIGQLAGGIAHELNNPLSGVLGQSQIVLESLQPSNPLYEHVKKIERAAKRCKDSVTKLLRFSRQREYEYTEVFVNDVIEDVLSLADSDLKSANIEVVKNFSPIVKPLVASMQHLQQVILNVINNAIQAMSQGGRLTVRTGIKKLEDGGNFVEISFTDTGEGIPKENLDHVFEPFFSTRPKDRSAGVGLAISRDIIEHHGGVIVAESEGPGKGATFYIGLPL